MTGSRLREALERIVVAFDDNRLGEVVTIARAALEDQADLKITYAELGREIYALENHMDQGEGPEGGGGKSSGE